MSRNKFWLGLFLFLLLIPQLAYGQNLPDMPDYAPATQPVGTSAKPTWNIILSPQLIVRLAANDWRENKDQLITEVKELNPDLIKFKILPQGDKRSLLFIREVYTKQEKLTIETNPQVFASREAGNTNPLDKFDVNSWLQTTSQANIRQVTTTSQQGQVIWKISAIPQTVTPRGEAGAGTNKLNPEGSNAPGASGKNDGWFNRVITHSTLVSNFRKGGFIMYFILLCSLGGTYIFIERSYELRRKNLMPPEFLEEVLKKLPEKSLSHEEHKKRVRGLISYCEEQDKPIASSLRAGLSVFHQGILGIKSAVMSSNHHEAAILGKGLGLLEVFANIAPLLGLLGTVLGMIKAFEMISLAGTGRAEVVAAGISEALITTAGGLLVGIPLLVCFHILEGKIEGVLIDVEEFCMDVIERLIRVQEEE